MTNKKLILYFLILLYITSFVSSLVITVILSTGNINLSNPLPHQGDHEAPILGQFGPISTVVLILGIPLLILVTLGGYAYWIGALKR